MAVGLLLHVGERLPDPGAAGAVGRLEVRDHHADVGQLVLRDGVQQVRQRRGGDDRQVGVTDGFRGGVDEVGRQLVQHDDERFALEQVHPGRLPGGRQWSVVVIELLALAELLGDGAPDAERSVALAPREGDHADGARGGARRIEVAHDGGTVFRALCEQAEGEQIVGLAPAHRLGEPEDALGGLALQAAEPFCKQGPHALGDVVLGEERGGVDDAGHEGSQVEHGVPAGGVEGTGPGRAGLFDGQHGGTFSGTGCGVA